MSQSNPRIKGKPDSQRTILDEKDKKLNKFESFVDSNEKHIAQLASKLESGDVSGLDKLMEFYATKASRWSFNNMMGLFLQKPDIERPVTTREVKKYGHVIKPTARKLDILVPIELKFDADGNRIKDDWQKKKAESQASVTGGGKDDAWLAGESKDADPAKAFAVEASSKQVADEETQKEDEKEVEVASTRRIFWPVSCVVDLGHDTDGPALDTGFNKHPEASTLLDALMKHAKEDLKLSVSNNHALSGGAAGSSDGRGGIAVYSGLTPESKFSTLAHEIAHEKMHSLETRTKDGLSPKVRELHAEGASYLVCKHFGLEGTKTAAYLKGNGISAKELLEHMQVICKASREIIRGVSSHLAQKVQADTGSESAQNSAVSLMDEGEPQVTIEDFNSIEDIDELGACVRF